MNPSDPNDLSRTLAEWRVNPKADPNFRPAVWQHIQQRSRETWGSYVQGHLAGWAVAAVVTVVGATFTGHALAQSKIEAGREEMAVSYLVNLDPRVLANLRN